jgi:hypothetical protein
VPWDPAVSPPHGIPAATGGVDTGQDPQFFHPATTRDAQGNVLDLFCGGETSLGDGRMMSTGGTLAYDDGGRKSFAGRPDTMAFDPVTQQRTVLGSMAHGRWYPSVIILGDGRVPAAAGLDETGLDRHNKTLESYCAASDRWQGLAIPPDPPEGFRIADDGHAGSWLTVRPTQTDTQHSNAGSPLLTTHGGGGPTLSTCRSEIS